MLYPARAEGLVNMIIVIGDSAGVYTDILLRHTLVKYESRISRSFKARIKKVQISKVKLATVVEGDQKAPFSIATTLKCRGGRYSFPWIAPLYP